MVWQLFLDRFAVKLWTRDILTALMPNKNGINKKRLCQKQTIAHDSYEWKSMAKLKKWLHLFSNAW